MSRRTQKNVGVIGLGIIGRRVADNLRRRGFHVFVWNRTPRPFPNFVGSPAEVAELCDFVQIFVSDDEALMQMVQEMKSSLHVQHVIMAHSTVAPHTMRNAAEVVKRRGAQFLDAPFTGSKIPAEKGELVYYVAGDDAAYRRAKPVLQASSKEIIEIGEIGQATTVKIATNMVTAATVQAAAEALALVHNSGLAPEKLTAALSGNASNSGTLSMKLPKMIQGDFDPHFSVKHMLKDVQIATRMARSYGLTLGATEAARDSLLDEANSGRADQDFSSLVRFFFPDGVPGEISAAAEEDDAQQKLNGVDDEAAAQLRREEDASDEREAARTEPAGEARPAATADDEKRAERATPEGENRGDSKSSEARGSTGNTAGSAPARSSAGVIPAAKEEPTATAAEATDDARATEPAKAPDRAPAKEDSSPVGSETGAVAAEREPAADEPEPAADEPEPAADEPEPAADEPEPAADEPEPAADEPEPAADEPEPAADEPEPAVDEREPAAYERASVGEDREPRSFEELRGTDDDEEAETADGSAAEERRETMVSPGRAEESEPELTVAGAQNERAEAAQSSSTRVTEPGDYDLGGEPPRERRANEEREAAPSESPPSEKDEPAAPRSFLSRMFGKGGDY